MEGAQGAQGAAEACEGSNWQCNNVHGGSSCSGTRRLVCVVRAAAAGGAARLGCQSMRARTRESDAGVRDAGTDMGPSASNAMHSLLCSLARPAPVPCALPALHSQPLAASRAKVAAEHHRVPARPSGFHADPPSRHHAAASSRPQSGSGCAPTPAQRRPNTRPLCPRCWP